MVKIRNQTGQCDHTQPVPLAKSWRKFHIHHLRRNYEELLRAYIRATGKAANEVYAVEVLQWVIEQDIGKLS